MSLCLQRFREVLTLFLIALLPLHAFLVTIGTKILRGSMQSPALQIVLWKEALLAVILSVCIVEMLSAMKHEENRKKILRLDIVDFFIVFLVVLACLVSYFTHKNPLLFAYGFKYDFIPLCAFLLLRRVAWSEVFMQRTMNTLMAVAFLVAAYGIATLFLPQSFFTALGYSNLHSLYVPDGPIAAFQQIGNMGLQRIQSTMSGPNQLALWLLLPLSFAVLRLLYSEGESGYWLKRLFVFSSRKDKERCVVFLTCFLVLTALLLTFSRSAWIATSCIFVVIALQHAPKQFHRILVRVCAVAFFAVVLAAFLFPDVILRFHSSRDHFLRPMAAIHTITQNPLGLGLGTAGPASNRMSDACVYLPSGADVTWAEAHPNLCVFQADTQVLPSDHTCSCPLLPENWYLQIGIEMGVIGLVVFMLLLIHLARKILPIALEDHFAEGVYLSLTGISVAAFFLHAWEDSAVAYTLWILLAVAISIQKKAKEE